VTHAVVSKFGVTESEFDGLRRCLAAAIDGRCIPEWEFEALIGCTRHEARDIADIDPRELELDEQLLDRVVALLSALSGAAQPSSPGSQGHEVDLDELHALLGKLLGGVAEQEHPELVSSVSLRLWAREEPAKKRGA